MLNENIIRATDANVIQLTSDVIRRGGVVAIPTDTIYGKIWSSHFHNLNLVYRWRVNLKHDYIKLMFLNWKTAENRLIFPRNLLLCGKHGCNQQDLLHKREGLQKAARYLCGESGGHFKV